ncbi:ATP-binding protein [Neorhizobium sp. T6_25]|uniref:ATP-binding protein n=1 Tax=Neorhizobium sp. T6_25 TaxID=2093833 RepID=UPI000CF842CE|nr:ATP-binding protein [Neorhizobium sp. T6_25]
MDTHLQGRLRNFTLPRRSGLIPLFEAVVNSIHAIEERFGTPEAVGNSGTIDIHIRREPEQLALNLPGGRRQRTITGFEIVDNGVGFTQQNWDSFNQLDFTLKADKGCKGVGRLTWLKAFDDVAIESWYIEDQVLNHRSFDFSKSREVSGGEAKASKMEHTIGSRVFLRGFRKSYAASVEKTAEAIAARLLEHTIWYFVRKAGVPKIVIHDEQLDAPIDLDDLFDEHMHAESKHEEFTIKGVLFDITHVKFRLKQDRKHVLAYCAGQRLVLEEQIDLPGLTSSVQDHDGPYRYAGYIVSDFLDERVVAERTGFDIEDEAEGLLAETEISLGDIREAAAPLIQMFLGQSLLDNIEAGQKRLQTFIQTKAPHYLPIVRHMDGDELFVDPSTTDAMLDRALHTRKYQVEQSLLEEGSRLLRPDLTDTVESYSERVASYMEKLQTVKQSDLAAYVTHRRVVLDLLGSALPIKDDGSFEREEVVHNLLMPMGVTSEDLDHLRGSNLWLLNERLAFHQHYLGSDKSLSALPFTGATGGKEPDIVSLNIYDNPHLFGEVEGANQPSITIVEIKRPMRKNYGLGEEKDPIDQAYNYVRRIRAGGVLRSGRRIANASEIPAYIYVLADLTPKMQERCEYAALNASPDGLSYFGWNNNPSIKAYIEVIDFEGLLGAAAQRNAAFFEQLGLGSTPTASIRRR